jgi:hypothetical protein
MKTHIDYSHPHLVAKKKLFNQPNFLWLSFLK